MGILHFKKIWTTANFDQMGWHDSKIYGISFGPKEYELCFDIDYILKWIKPANDNVDFDFLVVPATLIFKNVYDLDLSFSSIDTEIEDIIRENPVLPKNAGSIEEDLEYDWIIGTTGGSITFKSVGYTQYARQNAHFLNNQTIGFESRGGVSFSTNFM